MRLRVAEFWKGSPVRWFYLEWTRPGEPAPTRQLVFRVFEPTGHEEHFLDGDVFSLPDPARYVGEWSKAEPFTALKPGDLRLVEECNLDVVRTMTVAFTLITAGNRCPGDVAGSPYMRFEFSLTSSELDLLEQPRDTRGNVPPNSRLDPFHYWRMTREPS